MEDYYTKNAKAYEEETRNADRSSVYSFLRPYLPKGKLSVLDVGFGSGRDRLYFKSLGYDVEGIDTSLPFVIDAKKKKFYFRLRVGEEIVISDRDGNPEDVIETLKSLKDILITGPDAALFASKLSSFEDLHITVDPEAPRCLSYALEKLGMEKYKIDGPDDIGEGPVYIRRSDAEEMLLAKAREAKGE